MHGLKTKHQSPIIKQVANFNEFDKRLYYSSIHIKTFDVCRWRQDKNDMSTSTNFILMKSRQSGK